ncbi:Muskelin [Ceratobasidium sp. AG-Ba]|nr:Muskelin [Ceratobasidium sp. AG-Ba]
MRELLSAKLNDDGVAQTFSLNYKAPNSEVAFPCQYIKICPISAHGKSYNMSIWHVALSGVSTPSFVKEVHDTFLAHKNTQTLHLILKHLRRNNFLAGHSALLAQTNAQVEHPRVTELHDALVLRGNLAKAEQLVEQMAREDNLFEHCARVSPPGCSWKRVTPNGSIPPGRGGHQLCVDPDSGLIYLFGGWDGSKNLADFWSYSIAKRRWTMLSEDTCADGGPSARSCHNMVFSSSTGNHYILGQLKEAPKPGASPQPQRGDGDFFMHFTRGSERGTWADLSSGGLESVGGPPSLSDPQMVIDEEKRVLYVFGGRVDNPAERDGQQSYSGMFSFHLDLKSPDSARPDGSLNRVNIHSRTGHGMVLYPKTHEIFVVGGRRSNSKYQPDMHSFNPSTRVSQRLPFDSAIANTVSAPRVCIDEELGEIYVLIWQNSERDRERSLYDPVNKVFYMFGGNTGEDGIPRLNDLWSMRLDRPTVDELLRKALLAVRKFRFKKMCNVAPPFEALSYLQTKLAEVVDQLDEDESADLRAMLSYLLAKSTNGKSDREGHEEGNVQTSEGERKERRELFDFLMQFVAPDQREPDTELCDIIENV